jgi:hypothetical protein
MAANPILEEHAGGPAAQMIAGLAGFDEPRARLLQIEEEAGGRASSRRLSVYPAEAGFDLLGELEYLTWRTIEPNIFFNPRFLIPAMPRLDDRRVRLMVVRDGDEERSRLRFLMPYTIERPGFSVSAPIIRAWTTPFGPQGSPLIDSDDPVGVIEDVFAVLARPHLKLPDVLVLPEIRIDGPTAQLIRAAAIGRGLPFVTTEVAARPFLEHRGIDGDEYLREALGSHHRREYRRLWRRLANRGSLAYGISRSPDDVRRRFEDFLTLEAAGWKGRRGSAMAVDRYQAAFAREAVNSLAERDLVRIHTLDLDGSTIAALVVFVESGEAWTWKTAFDERFSEFSPGTLLMIELLKTHLEDPNILRTDSCATPDHPVVSRLFLERRNVGTLLVGLNPGADHAVRQAAAQIDLYRQTRDVARMVRDRLRRMTRRR